MKCTPAGCSAREGSRKCSVQFDEQYLIVFHKDACEDYGHLVSGMAIAAGASNSDPLGGGPMGRSSPRSTRCGDLYTATETDRTALENPMLCTSLTFFSSVHHWTNTVKLNLRAAVKQAKTPAKPVCQCMGFRERTHTGSIAHWRPLVDAKGADILSVKANHESIHTLAVDYVDTRPWCALSGSTRNPLRSFRLHRQWC